MLWRSIVLTALSAVTLACEPRAGQSPAASAVRDSQLDAMRDSAQRVIEAGLIASAPVEVRGPTVVAFYPGVADSGSLVDTLALVVVQPFRRRLERYRAACAAAGFHFEVRDSRGVQVSDPRANMVHLALTAPDSVGLVVAIPGEPPRIWYGLQLEASLAARLRAVLPGPRARPPIGT